MLNDIVGAGKAGGHRDANGEEICKATLCSNRGASNEILRRNSTTTESYRGGFKLTELELFKPTLP